MSFCKAAGVDTDEDYIEVVPLTSDEFKGYDDEEYEEIPSPIRETGVYDDDDDYDGHDAPEVTEVEESDPVLEDEIQTVEQSEETLSSRHKDDRIKSLARVLSSRNCKRKLADSSSVADLTEGKLILVYRGNYG